jgi:hypothetical protein
MPAFYWHRGNACVMVITHQHVFEKWRPSALLTRIGESPVRG